MNISATALGPTAEITSVHGYMKIISMSKARNSIAIVYQRTWNWLTACSAGGNPPENGMAVGADVFETCVWIGRFIEVIGDVDTDLVKRHPVKLHHCHSSKANDSNIRQALVDRFAPGQPNHGKGTKARPGWFHGFHSDIWQAYALAVYAADQLNPTSAQEAS